MKSRTLVSNVFAKNLLLSSIAVITIAIGWMYPIIGFVVPVVMGIGLTVGIIRGRYTCGNICPRGAFYNAWLQKVSMHKKIPSFLKKIPFRWSILFLLMGFMAFRILQNPGSVTHLGFTFWTMCAVTTLIGIVLGILYKPRAWCSFCPIGTLQNTFGGHRNKLRIDSSKCINCKKCEKHCPLNLGIVSHKEKGVLEERDCLKCRVCSTVCPKQALEVPSPKIEGIKAFN
jgi:polyferredoxin